MLLEPIDDARTAAFVRALSWESPVRIATSRVLAFNGLGVALERSDDVGRVEVFTDPNTVTELRDHFLSGTHLREYTRTETLDIRSQSTPVPTLALSDSEAIAITGLPAGEQIAVNTGDETFLERTNQAFSE